MGVTQDSSMEDTIAGLGVGDHGACAAFAQHQADRDPENLESLAQASAVLDDVLRDLCLDRAEELMAFKTLDEFPPMPTGLVQSALEAARQGDEQATREMLEGLRFDSLIALRSTAGFLRAEAKQQQPRAAHSL